MSARHQSDVRIWASGANSAVGVGFLVGPEHLITCAHVVASALGTPDVAGHAEMPSGELNVDFPMLATAGTRERRRARVYAWRGRGLDPAPDDVALLKLAEPAPAGTAPIFALGKPADGEDFVALAVRAGIQQPVLIGGTCHGPVTQSRINITSDSAERAVRRGSSGGAAWSTLDRGVIGMVVEGFGEASGSLIPISLLAAFCEQETNGRVRIAMSEVRPAANSAPPTPIAARLARVKPGTPVALRDVPSSIVRAYAASLSLESALGLISEASALVINLERPGANREHAYVIEPYDLRHSVPSQFWHDAFAHACMLGPRMVAALLLLAPPGAAARADGAIDALLSKLEQS